MLARVLDWYKQRHPGLQVILGFALLILTGTCLLSLPISTPADRPLTVTDAFFTATSAVCVTGLIVVQTPHYFTWFGELLLLVLFQIGGIGIIYGSTMLYLGVKESMHMQQRLALQQTFLDWPYDRIRNVFKHVFGLFFGIEALGTVVLTGLFWRHMSFGDAFWHALFHSVSAVCNAGFSLNPNSLVPYRDEPAVLGTMAVLIIFGGLGFVVIAELLGMEPADRRYSLHTRTMVLGTVTFLLGGTFLFGFLEPGTSWLSAFFQSVTARTAGFNSVRIDGWRTPSLLVMMFLMFVGAGPASTAGGIKVTTFFASAADVYGRVKQREEIHWLDRRLPRQLVNNSITLFSLAIVIVGLFTFLLTITESAPLDVITFEVFSALGTVGLSLGLTPELTVVGKWIIILAMFLGRLGPLTFVILLVRRRDLHYTYPEERMLIG